MLPCLSPHDKVTPCCGWTVLTKGDGNRAAPPASEAGVPFPSVAVTATMAATGKATGEISTKPVRLAPNLSW